MSISKAVICIDLENIIKFSHNIIDTKREIIKIYIFIGQNQCKIPIDTVIELQKLNKPIEWIKISGQGKNALDFHIAYFLGELNKTLSKDFEFIILSKDTGFDPLIKYINNSGRKCFRQENTIK